MGRLAGAAIATMAASPVLASPEVKPEMRHDPNVIPDRVSIGSASPFFWPYYRKLGVRLDGRERLGDVHEFCVSEGWVEVRDSPDHANNRWNLRRIHGVVEPYFKVSATRTARDEKAAIRAAKIKRAIKAARQAKGAR